MLERSFGHFWKAYVSDSSHRPPKLQIMLVASPRNQPYFHAEKLQVDLHQTAALKYKLESSPGRPKLSRPALRASSGRSAYRRVRMRVCCCELHVATCAVVPRRQLSKTPDAGSMVQ